MAINPTSMTDSQKLDLLVKELGVPLTPGGVAALLLQRSLDLENKVDALTAAVGKLTAGLTVTGTLNVKPTT